MNKEKTYEEGFKDGLEAKAVPMGVSEWRKMGKECGYSSYFEPKEKIAIYEELIDREDSIIKDMQAKYAPLKKEYDDEYRLWFTGHRNPKRMAILKEYEDGAKGNRLFSLQEKIDAKQETISHLKGRIEELKNENT